MLGQKKVILPSFFTKNDKISSQKHLHPVDLEDADIAHLSNLSGSEQFDAARAVAEIVPERNAVPVVLHLTLACEQRNIHRLRVCQHFAHSIDVNGVHKLKVES